MVPLYSARVGSNNSGLLNDSRKRLRFTTHGDIKASKCALIGRMQRVAPVRLAPLQGSLIICCVSTHRESSLTASQKHYHVPGDQ